MKCVLSLSLQRVLTSPSLSDGLAKTLYFTGLLYRSSQLDRLIHIRSTVPVGAYMWQTDNVADKTTSCVLFSWWQKHCRWLIFMRPSTRMPHYALYTRLSVLPSIRPSVLRPPIIIIIIIIIITKTIFMVLSSWQSHCESSPGSFDECRWTYHVHHCGNSKTENHKTFRLKGEIVHVRSRPNWRSNFELKGQGN